MENQKINQQFREEEIANIRRWDKERNEYISNPFPKIAGRLRLAHEANEALSIETEIIRYDEKVAVVVAVSKTSKGNFKGIGMASIERDQKLAHAILELAETRSIARSLRFAGYGIEYTSAEEMPLTENGNGNGGNGHHARSNPNDNLPPGAIVTETMCQPMEIVMVGVGPIIPETEMAATGTIAHLGQIVMAMGTADCRQSNFSTCKS
jgi:hypothetical protein